ncbi:DoxX family membrane protein [Agrococcus sp. TF02-05]|uniref:DoxX family protein n=1 Tax=Agrococcus sp. TF02-05 TaxID=2815211 RepID=UPI001AA1866F|nr:DoxX family membrane protein [Agrococcus sp. TF02-05]MBO1769916.1 DoxX family membrane protein [Agrococcus sp. TF02-05]
MTAASRSEAPSRAGAIARSIVRVLLGASLLLAGIGHLTVARAEFQAQVPPWLPLDPDFVVVASGIVEIALGLALLVLRRRRALVGLVVAAFFIAVFPGNIAQWTEGRDGLGLDTDAARFGRLLFQPLLVIAALWSTYAWREIRRWWRDRRA